MYFASAQKFLENNWYMSSADQPTKVVIVKESRKIIEISNIHKFPILSNEFIFFISRPVVEKRICRFGTLSNLMANFIAIRKKSCK